MRSESNSKAAVASGGLHSFVTADRIAGALLVVLVAGLYFHLPRQGDISSSDAARHALNGVFVHDFIRDMPFRHPAEYAYDYYRQWPGLTILFYPPLFYGVLAVAYAIFGVSEGTALLVELAFLLALAWGAYRLSRHWLEPAAALATAALLVGAPELLYWAQQIMLDVPAYALLIWAAEFQLRFLKSDAKRHLMAAVLCVAAAVYTKYNAAFFAPVMALSLLYARGWRFALERRALEAAALGLVLLLPAVAIFLVFGQYDMQQAGAIADSVAPRWSVAGLTYYAALMPVILSWPTAALACCYALALPVAARFRLPTADMLFLAAWVAIGYAFYSLISLKEPRHILFITYPIVFAAVAFLDRVLAPVRWRAVVSLALALGVTVFSIVTRPAPYVTGMRQASDLIGRLAPPESNVAVWSPYDGTFVFAMRATSGRPDLGVVRLDKLLFRDVAVSFERGSSENTLSPDQIAGELATYHCQYVVMQTEFLDDRAPVKALQEALQSDKFKEVERIRMTTNHGGSAFRPVTELVVYRLVADVPKGRVAPPLQLKLIDKTL
jgi:hypothetical protein